MATMDDKPFEEVVKIFESRFSEVHIFDNETHPPSLSASICPAGAQYLTIVGNILKSEGEPIGEITTHPLDDWFNAAITLYELRGRPKYLWWRNSPQFENGIVYSRFAMTHSGPFVSYKGKAIAA